MKRVFKPAISAAICIALMGCQNVPNSAEATPDDTSSKSQTLSADLSPREREVVEALIWVETANPLSDAQTMLTSGTPPQLMAFASRAISFPGITPDQYAAIESKVTYKVAQGGGDVIHGDTHHKLRKQLSAYAKAYNQAIYAKIAQP